MTDEELRRLIRRVEAINSWIVEAGDAMPPRIHIEAASEVLADVVTELLGAQDEIAWAEAAAKHASAQMASARDTLLMLGDRMDDFTYQEFAAILEDEPLDINGDPYTGERSC